MQTETPEQRLLKTLYLEQYHSLFLYANAVLRDSGLAEEAVQDTFRIACGRSRSFLPAKTLLAGWCRP